MARAKARARGSHCSFCGKSQSDVRKLVAGPGVFICDECVGLCNEILAKELGPDETGWRPAARTDEELLRSLVSAGAVHGAIDASLAESVAMLRSRRVTWEQIGSALGVSRQSAWERFSGET